MKNNARQATAKPDWTDPVAPPPGSIVAGVDGNDGEDGVDGFPGTIVDIDAGCIVGRKNMLTFDIQSGSGSDGQHGSDGLQGIDGVDGPDGFKMKYGDDRYNYCNLKTSEGFQIIVQFNQLNDNC